MQAEDTPRAPVRASDLVFAPILLVAVSFCSIDPERSPIKMDQCGI